MPDIPFPVTSAPGQRPQEGGGRLINCYASMVSGVPASQVLWERSVGTRRFAVMPDVDNVNCRALVPIGGVLVHLPFNQAYSVDAGGTMTFLGALGGETPLTWGQNTKSPVPDTFAVSDGAAWLLFSDSAPTSYDGGGNLAAPNSVTVMNNYGLFTSQSGLIQSTELNSTTLQSNANESVPFGLLRGVEYNNEFFVFGTSKFRVYRDIGAAPFPLEFSGIERDIGIAGTYAIAGYQDNFPEALIWAASDDRVYMMNGYNPDPISEDDVQNAIAALTQTEKRALVANAYVSNGQSFWNLTSPGKWTWEYNLNTGLWNERQTYQKNGWSGRVTQKAFGRWLVGDEANGNLYQMIDGWPFEGDLPLVWTLESGIVSGYPNRVNIPWSYFRFGPGVGLDGGTIPEQTDPKVLISWSLNGGGTYGTPLPRGLGSEGEYDRRVSIGTTGDSTSYGIRFRLEVSDTVRVGFMGASYADIEVLAA